MPRKSTIAALVIGLLAVSGVAVGAVSSDNLSVDNPDIADDEIVLTPADTPEGDEYVGLDVNGNLSVAIPGVNAGSSVVIDELFTAQYTGTDQEHISFEHASDEITIIDSDGNPVDGSSPAVEFSPEDETQSFGVKIDATETGSVPLSSLEIISADQPREDTIGSDSEIALSPADTPEGYEYTRYDSDGNLSVTVPGVNAGSSVVIDELFTAQYTGTGQEHISFQHASDEVTIIDADGNPVDGSSPAVEFSSEDETQSFGVKIDATETGSVSLSSLEIISADQPREDTIDSDTEIALSPAETPEGDEYAGLDVNGNLSVAIPGVNAGTSVVIDELFTAQYTGTDQEHISFEHASDEITIIDSDGNPVDGSSPAVEFSSEDETQSFGVKIDPTETGSVSISSLEIVSANQSNVDTIGSDSEIALSPAKTPEGYEYAGFDTDGNLSVMIPGVNAGSSVVIDELFTAQYTGTEQEHISFQHASDEVTIIDADGNPVDGSSPAVEFSPEDETQSFGVKIDATETGSVSLSSLEIISADQPREDTIGSDSEIALSPADTPEGYEYTRYDSDGNLSATVPGVNAGSSVVIDELFTAQYTGTEQEHISFEHASDEVTIIDADGNPVDGPLNSVEFSSKGETKSFGLKVDATATGSVSLSSLTIVPRNETGPDHLSSDDEVALSPADTPAGREYAKLDANRNLSINVNGLNAGSKVRINDVFKAQYNGSNSSYVYFNETGNHVTILDSDGNPVESGPNSVNLTPQNQSETFGVMVDATNTSSVSINSINIVADAQMDSDEVVGIDPIDLSGSGTAADPYVITNASELQAMEDDLDAHYVLDNDINATRTSQWNSDDGFDPVGDNSTGFNGSLDGEGHTVTGLTINRPGEDHIGLIGYADSGAVVSNISLTNITVNGSSDVGVLVGLNDGSVRNVTATGAVSGDNYIGGLAGGNGGSIENSTTASTVDGDNYVGGLVGRNDEASITDTFAVGSVTGERDVGGLVGSNVNSTIQDSYWDTESTGQSSSDGGTGLTTKEMTGWEAKENMPGLEFGSIWKIQSDDYPEFASITSGEMNETGTQTVIVQLTPLSTENVSASEQDEYVTALKSHATETQSEFKSFANRTQHVEIKRDYWITNALLVRVDTNHISMEQFETVDGFVAVERDNKVSVLGERITDTPDTSQQQDGFDVSIFSSSRDFTNAIDHIRVDEVWDEYPNRGDGVRVSVIDTGVDPDHPDIDIKDENWKCYTDCQKNQSGPHDEVGHGTHVSGTIIGEDSNSENIQIGVAPDATLLHAKALDADGRGSYADTIEAMEWSVENNADIISLSFGVNGKSTSYARAVRNAQKSGTVVISSIGNQGVGASASPGNVYDSLGVGSTEVDSRHNFGRETDEISEFSGGEVIDSSEFENRDYDVPDDWPNQYTVPAVTAPGSAIGSANASDDGLDWWNGTSMAAPHVSGVAALMISNSDEDLSPNEIKNTLESTSVDLGEPTDRQGQGRIDARAAVDAVNQDLAADQDFYNVTIDGINTSVTENKNVTVEYTVTNTGDTEGTQDIRVRVDGTIEAIENNVTLDPEETVSNTFTYQIEQGDNWPFETTISSANDSVSDSATRYVITNAAELQAIEDDPGGYYILGNDINATQTSQWNSGNGFAPVTAFNGSLDGNGHTVTGLTINRSDERYVGLIGAADSGAVVRDISLTNVTINGSSDVGSLVGDNDGSIRNATATGTVSGSDNVGGLVGQNRKGSIRNAKATANISAISDVGGLVGDNDGSVRNVTATGTVSGSDNVGGLVGYSPDGIVEDSYWDIESTGQSSSAGGAGLTSKEMTGLEAKGNMPGLDFNSVWITCSGDYPALRAQTSGDHCGDGTETNPYVITTASGLQAMEDDLDAHYVLGDDINATQTSEWNSGEGFDPVGNHSTGFNGSLDGDGHTVTGLTIDRIGGFSAANNAGLIGVADSDAAIHDISLKNSTVRAGEDAGVLVGYNDGGSIRHVTVTGTVKVGNARVGGLVGNNQGGSIRNTKAAVTVDDQGWDSNDQRGGLVGVNNGSISDSIAVGAVSGDDGGGLVGQRYAGIDDKDVNSTVEDSYWDTESTGQSSSAGGTGLTTREMTGSAAKDNMSGLEFGSVWKIDLDEPDEYPSLRSRNDTDDATEELIIIFEQYQHGADGEQASQTNSTQGANNDTGIEELQRHAEEVKEPFREQFSSEIEEAYTSDTIEEANTSSTGNSAVTIKNELWIISASLAEVDTDRVSQDELLDAPNVVDVIENEEIEDKRPDIEESTEEFGENETVPDSQQLTEESSKDASHGLQYINVPEVWDKYDSRGEGVKIAVIDSGVNPDHPDIDISSDNWKCFTDCNQRGPHDDTGHGTAVSGVVVGGDNNDVDKTIGVAPDATLMHAKVIDKYNGISVNDRWEATEWAINNDADIISISIRATSYPTYNHVVHRNAYKEDVTVIAGAGNDGPYNVPARPASSYDTISVGAVDSLADTIWEYSSTAEFHRTDFNNAGEDWPSSWTVPSVVAPGRWVLTADHNPTSTTCPRPNSDIHTKELSCSQGTSLATPHVSGLAALMQANTEEYVPPKEMRSAIESTANTDRISDPYRDSDIRKGEGVIDARAAVEAVTGFSVTIEDIDRPIIKGEKINVDVRISNGGTESDTQILTLRGPNETQTDTVVSLSAGETKDLTLQLSTANTDATDGYLTVASEDDTATQRVTINYKHNWQTWGDQANTGHNPNTYGPDSSNKQPSVKWQADISGSAWLHTPTVVDDTVYFRNRWIETIPDENYNVVHSNLTAYNASSGSKHWQITGDGPDSPANVVDDTAYVQTTGGKLKALNASSGEVRWSVDDGMFTMNFPPVVQDDTVYAESLWFGEIRAYDASDGTELWRTNVTDNRGFSGVTPLAVADNTVYGMDSASGSAYALDASNGEIRWKTSADVRASAPTVVDDTIYYTKEDGGVLAIDASDGSKRWMHNHPSSNSMPAVADGTVYVGSRDGKVYALDATDGDKRWEYETGGSVESSPAVVDDTVYVGSRDGNVYALDATDGDKRWEYETGGSVKSSPAVVSGTVYVGNDDGKLYAIEEGDAIILGEDDSQKEDKEESQEKESKDVPPIDMHESIMGSNVSSELSPEVDTSSAEVRIYPGEDNSSAEVTVHFEGDNSSAEVSVYP